MDINKAKWEMKKAMVLVVRLVTRSILSGIQFPKKSFLLRTLQNDQKEEPFVEAN